MLEFTIPLYYTQGGGESLDQLYDRCTAAMERIGGKHKGMGSPGLYSLPYWKLAESLFSQVFVSL